MMAPGGYAAGRLWKQAGQVKSGLSAFPLTSLFRLPPVFPTSWTPDHTGNE